MAAPASDWIHSWSTYIHLVPATPAPQLRRGPAAHAHLSSLSCSPGTAASRHPGTGTQMPISISPSNAVITHTPHAAPAHAAACARACPHPPLKSPGRAHPPLLESSRPMRTRSHRRPTPTCEGPPQSAWGEDTPQARHGRVAGRRRRRFPTPKPRRCQTRRSCGVGRRRRCPLARPATPRPASASALAGRAGCPREPTANCFPTRTPVLPPLAPPHGDTQMRHWSPERRAAPRRAWATAGTACRRGRAARRHPRPKRRAPHSLRWRRSWTEWRTRSAPARPRTRQPGPAGTSSPLHPGAGSPSCRRCPIASWRNCGRLQWHCRARPPVPPPAPAKAGRACLRDPAARSGCDPMSRPDHPS
eukprot:scaffold18267_cov146-Isochrysis_galbana.AAC.5